MGYELDRDLDKAVMEVQPKQRSRHSRLSCNSLGNNRLHNLLSFGARVIIELWVEIATMIVIIGVTETKWSKCKERKRQEEEQRLSHNNVLPRQVEIV